MHTKQTVFLRWIFSGNLWNCYKYIILEDCYSSGSRGHKVGEIRPGFFGGTKPCYKKNCILRGGSYKCWTLFMEMWKTVFIIQMFILTNVARILPPLQVVSNSKFVSVGVQSPTEINAPRGCAVILIGICQLRWPESRAKSHGRSTWMICKIKKVHWIFFSYT